MRFHLPCCRRQSRTPEKKGNMEFWYFSHQLNLFQSLELMWIFASRNWTSERKIMQKLSHHNTKVFFWKSYFELFVSQNRSWHSAISIWDALLLDNMRACPFVSKPARDEAPKTTPSSIWSISEQMHNFGMTYDVLSI